MTLIQSLLNITINDDLGSDTLISIDTSKDDVHKKNFGFLKDKYNNLLTYDYEYQLGQ